MAKTKYPIDVWFGKYQGYILRLYSSSRLDLAEEKIEKFLKYFPDYKGWEEFTIADVNDYRIWRTREGANPKTLAIELREVRLFFKWMAEEQDIPLHNPVKRVPLPPSKNRLTLDSFRRLLSASNDELKDWLLCQVTGDEYKGSLKGRGLYLVFIQAASRCGFTWLNSSEAFKFAARGLWREVMRREAPKLRAEFLEYDDDWSDIT